MSVADEVCLPGFLWLPQTQLQAMLPCCGQPGPEDWPPLDRAGSAVQSTFRSDLSSVTSSLGDLRQIIQPL